MLSDYFGNLKTPKELALNKDNYTGGGLILWSNLNKIFKGMRFVWRDYKEDKARIAEACKNPRRAVILTVDNDSHWVVAVRPTYFGNDYIIIDPWDGKKKTLKSAYKRVSGAAFFEKVI
jgi:hypothetical protein